MAFSCSVTFANSLPGSMRILHGTLSDTIGCHTQGLRWTFPHRPTHPFLECTCYLLLQDSYYAVIVALIENLTGDDNALPRSDTLVLVGSNTH